LIVIGDRWCSSDTIGAGLRFIFLVPVSLFTDEQLLFELLNPTAEVIPVIYAFPNTYTVGITSLGYQVV
jgi:hypothetical protein